MWGSIAGPLGVGPDLIEGAVTWSLRGQQRRMPAPLPPHLPNALWAEWTSDLKLAGRDHQSLEARSPWCFAVSLPLNCVVVI